MEESIHFSKSVIIRSIRVIRGLPFSRLGSRVKGRRLDSLRSRTVSTSAAVGEITILPGIRENGLCAGWTNFRLGADSFR